MALTKFTDKNKIYPLTVVSVRFGSGGNNFVAFNCDCDNEDVFNVQLGEYEGINLEGYLEENVSPMAYGIGATVDEALEDLIRRQDE